MTTNREREYAQNLEAERALLGSILLDQAGLYVALDHVSELDFFIQAHRLIFGAMCRVKGANHELDLVTVSEELGHQNEMEHAGGAAYVASLTEGVPLGAGTNVTEYCRIVKDRAMVRALLGAAENIKTQCLEDSRDVGALLESAHTALFDVAQREMLSGSGPQPISEIVAQTIPLLDKTAGQGIVLGTPTGYTALDAITAGWQESEFVVLAARPSMGKSALALDFARILCQRNIPVGIFSLEMSKRSLLLRLACRVSLLDSNRLRFGRLTKEEFDWLVRAMGEISTWPMWIDDTPGLSIEQLQWRLRALAQRAQPRLVVVDHMQLLHAKAENRTQEITRVSGGLQCAARELGRISKGTVLGLSQLSRLAVNDEPQLHHLRESGSIEQDADVVLFLWQRAEQDAHSTAPVERILKVGKQRNGPTGLAPLVFVPSRVGFEEEEWVKQELHDV